MSSSASSSHSDSDPDGIVVIEESDFVVLDEENSDVSSFKSAEDSEIVVVAEEDILDLDDDHGLNDDGLLALRVRHFAGPEEGNISNSVISGEVDKETMRSIDAETPTLEESHANTRTTHDSKNLEEEEEVPGASIARAASGSLHPSHSSSVPTEEWCSCPSKSTTG